MKISIIHPSRDRAAIAKPGGITKDAISVKNDSTWNQGEKLYLERLRRNFDLSPDEIKGHLKCGKAHEQWLSNKGVIIEYI